MILIHSLTFTLEKIDLSWQQTLRTESVNRMTYLFSLRWSFLEGPAQCLTSETIHPGMGHPGPKSSSGGF